VPEGDTIRRLAARIDHRLAGKTVLAATFRHPRLATVELERSTMHSADAYGKHLLIRFDDGRTLHAHMLMQGRVVLSRAFDVPSWRRRFEIEFPGGYLTGIDVPRLHLIRSRDEPAALAHLGPDLCGSYDHTAAVARITTAADRPLGAALLDQTLIAGFGNIYAVETPFICGISPFQPVGTIGDIERVVAVGAALIRTNAQLGPQNTTGRNLHRTEHWVLTRNRWRCGVCANPLLRISGADSPWKRRLALCANCQPDSPTTSVDRRRITRLLRTHPATRLLDLANGRLSVTTDQPVVVNDPRTGP
jgi:endonuclease-8